MKKLNLEIKEHGLFILIGLILFTLVTIESATVPLTHDEGNTIHCSTTSVFDIISYKDPVPNNHILNTLLIKFNQSIFGDQLFTNRLHNILFFIPYFLFSVLLSRLLYKDFWPRVTLVVMLSMNAYLLDFFSVTRGYGISLAFEMMSLYYLHKRIQSDNHSYSYWAVLWAALGVYANFTLLNYYMPLLLILSIHSIYNNYKEKPWLVLQEIGIMAVISLVLAGAIFVPLSRIVSTNQLTYWGMDGFYQNTVISLVNSLRSGVDYYNLSIESLSLGIVAIIAVLLVLGFFLWLRHKSSLSFMVTYATLAIVIVYNMAIFWIVDVPYLTGRTALLFVPLVCVALSTSVHEIYNYNKRLGISLCLLMISFITQHYIKANDTTTISEWYYDRDSYRVLDDLQDIIHTESMAKPVILNCHWLYFPSMDYHIPREYKTDIKLAPYGLKIAQDTSSQYYFAESNELEYLKENFEILKSYSNKQRYLLKRSK